MLMKIILVIYDIILLLQEKLNYSIFLKQLYCASSAGQQWNISFSETHCGEDDNLTAGVIHVLYDGEVM